MMARGRRGGGANIGTRVKLHTAASHSTVCPAAFVYAPATDCWEQSQVDLHARPMVHREQDPVDPPQSTSLSEKSCTPSVQYDACTV